ncbi:MAG: elongation factor P, partial [Candidatus Paceibacterota bacterium]
SYSDITNRTYIELDGQPYEVLDSHIFRKQQRKAVNQTKLRNLITGNVMERTFQQSDKVEKASIDTQPIIFIYEKRGDYIFHSKEDKSDRFSISEEVIGKQAIYLIEGMEVSGIRHQDAYIGITLPVKVELEVTDAPPNIKGNTAQGGNKRITLSSGAEIEVPMFIEAGDVIRVNTEKGVYVERVSKK